MNSERSLPIVGQASDEGLSCASRLKILADETRLGVLEQLLAGPKSVGEINRSLEIELSLLSHHLRVLREAGLVESRREGKQVIYRLAPDVQAKRGQQAIDLGCCLISFNEPTSD